MEATDKDHLIAELKRQLAAERMRSTRLTIFNQVVMDRLPEAIYVKDANGRYIAGNHAFIQLMQCNSIAELYGHTDEDFYDGESLEALRAIRRQVMNDPAGGSIIFEQPMILSDGLCHDLQMTQFRTEDKDGYPCLVGFAKDITAMRATEERAREAEKAREYFFATVSHEMRTPLNAIAGYAQILQVGADPEKARESLAAILSNTQSLIGVVDGMLTLSRLESGSVSFVNETTDVKEMVQQVTDAFTATTLAKKLELRVAVVGVPFVEIDRRQLAPALSRLVDNAVKFTDSGYVTVAAAFTNGTLTLAVSDSGVGIPEKDLGRIAEPYAAASVAGGGRCGSGLGLAIVKRLIERMGGTFSIRSVVGRGTTVTLTLPNVKAADEGQQKKFNQTQKMRTMRIEDPFRFDKRVLIVDDSSMNLRVLEGLLKVIGFKNIVAATNGPDALKHLQAEKFDIILSDVRMPEMDGPTLVREIRKMPAYADTPVYAITADTDAPKTCAGCGFNDYIFKPMTLAELKAIVC